MDYYSEIQHLEKELSSNSKSPQQLAAIQSKLNGVIIQYRGDDILGGDRYALYQVQAMLSYRLGEYDKAKRFIDYAVYVRGEDFKLATTLTNHLMKQEFKPKGVRKWWWLILAPISGLIVIAFLQLIVHFVLNQSANTASASAPTSLATLVNIVSVVVGVVSVILVLFLPIWIIELVTAKKYNEGHGYSPGLKRRTGILIAVFLATWYWAYTYKTDKGKFWLNFILGIGTAGYWAIIAWIWAIVHSTSRPEDFYKLYPYYQDLPKSTK